MISHANWVWRGSWAVALWVPSHPQRRAHPRGAVALGKEFPLIKTKHQIWSFPALRPHRRPAPGMCSLNLKSKQNSRVCDHRAILSLPPLPCHCLFPPCVYTHVLAYTCTHMHSQAHTVLTRTHNAFTDTHIHTHTHSLPHWPFPVSTCFSLASSFLGLSVVLWLFLSVCLLPLCPIFCDLVFISRSLLHAA